MQPCKLCGSLTCECASGAVGRLYDPMYWYVPAHQYYVNRRGNVVSPEMLREEHDRQAKLRALEEKKKVRLSNSVQKECSECGKDKPHDRDDYKCIVCRDGVSALPKNSYRLAA